MRPNCSMCVFINADLSTFTREVPDKLIEYNFALTPVLMRNYRPLATVEDANINIDLPIITFRRIHKDVFKEYR